MSPSHTSPHRRLVLVVTVLLLALGSGISLVLVVKARATAPPPITFNHQAMVQAGVPCLFCHTGATRAPAAGIPSMEKCMGCHIVIDKEKPEIQELAAYWERQEAIVWPRVNQLPRFVYFTHQVHVKAGLNCERCHGDVGHMAMAEPVVTMDMGWCLGCHLQQSNAEQLRDCVICHQ